VYSSGAIPYMKSFHSWFHSEARWWFAEGTQQQTIPIRLVYIQYCIQCINVTSTHVSTTDNYNPNPGTTLFWLKNVTSKWHHVYHMLQSLIWHPLLLQPRSLVTFNMMAHLFYLRCDITSKIPLSDSQSKCHKSPQCPVSHTQQKSTNPRISVLCALN
jgi:hypothetical protein